MGLITWIVLGLIVGVLAKWLMPGRVPDNWLITILLGIGGAMVGGYLGALLGVATVTGINVVCILLSVIGAAILLYVYKLVVKR